MTEVVGVVLVVGVEVAVLVPVDDNEVDGVDVAVVVGLEVSVVTSHPLKWPSCKYEMIALFNTATTAVHCTPAETPMIERN